MKKYKILITNIEEGSIEVEAESYAEALKSVHEDTKAEDFMVYKNTFYFPKCISIKEVDGKFCNCCHDFVATGDMCVCDLPF